MSLPTQLVAKIKSIPMDPIALANNFELAYMLSFTSNNISGDATHCSPRDTYHSPLSDYGFVDFDSNTYQQLYEDACKNYEARNSTVVSGIRNNFKEFFLRVASMTYKTALHKEEEAGVLSNAAIKPPTQEMEHNITQMRGNNPNEWPKGLEEFQKQINSTPWNAFAFQPEVFLNDFLKLVHNSIKNLITKLKNTEAKGELSKAFITAIQVLLGIIMRTNNQTFILQHLKQLYSLPISEILSGKDNETLLRNLENICQQIFDKIPVVEQQQYHMPKRLWEKGEAFMIMKKVHFQKNGGLGYFSVTTDGTYLYVYVSAINGGMFKVGTGRNSTTAGKIYLQKQIYSQVNTKTDEINWVFFKGKLYLKTSSKDPINIQVINPDTFKSESTIQLKCNPLFGHQALLNLNRNSILMTDGHKLYFLGKQLKITLAREQPQKPDNEELAKKAKQREEQQAKLKKKKPKKQKNQPQQTEAVQANAGESGQKTVQFVLYEFDIRDHKAPQSYQCDEMLVQELYVSFNNYFSHNQCRRALDLCQNDITSAVQWLVDQGEKERKNIIYYPTDSVIIAEAEITNNFNERNLKSSSEIVTKDNSILHIQNISESLWTMDQDQITCYSEVGIKIFSKNPKDQREVNGLKTTHIKTAQGKFPRNPEYFIVYDPYNSAFFTFTWPPDGAHYFPSAVLIGSDFKSSAQISYQKRVSLSSQAPQNLQQFGKWLLLELNLLDNSHCPNNGRINNWLWSMGQQINEINKQLNSNNETIDKRKLSHKRTKMLTKINKYNEMKRVFQKDKAEFQKNGKVRKQIMHIAPFAGDGSLENLNAIRQSFNQKLEVAQIYGLIVALQGWLVNSYNLMDNETTIKLQSIRDQLICIKKQLPTTIYKKMNEVFIQYFYTFFTTADSQQEFLMSLSLTQIGHFVRKFNGTERKGRKSMIYEIVSKDKLIIKYDSKSSFSEIFPNQSTSNAKISQQFDSIGNLLIEGVIENKDALNRQSSPRKNSSQKNNRIFFDFLQKIMNAHKNGIKLFQYVFLQAFRLLICGRTSDQYFQQLENLFFDSFKLLEKVIAQSSIQSCKQLNDPLLLVLQLYFASKCSFSPKADLVEVLIKIIQSLSKKDLLKALDNIEEIQYQGISQTSQKIYETPHPIEKGKSQNFPQAAYPEASLIFADFDKRCQSDMNHDIMTIQLIHENTLVGNSFNCNDGIFNTILKITGKFQRKLPYLILGNSVNIDFSSSGHARDSNSFGRYGFKFGLRPIYSGKLRYKKEGVEEIEKTFSSKGNFQKFINTLKLTVVVASNAIEQFTYLEKCEKDKNQKIAHILEGKVFKQGYEEDSLILLRKKQSKSFHNKMLEPFFNQQSHDGFHQLLKSLHKEDFQKCIKIKQNENASQQKSMENNGNDKLWNIEGIPSYIKTYLQKIKAFDGQFIQVFKEARELALPKGNYAMELRRPGFKEQFKKMWLQGQAILFLTVLKHSGLLHLNLKFSISYIKENLKAFQEARNDIFDSFIRRMQSVREWRDLIATYHINEKEEQTMEQKKQQKKEEKVVSKTVQVKRKGMTKTINLDRNGKKNTKVEQKIENVPAKKSKEQIIKERKREAEKTIRERLTDKYLIKSICKYKDIKHVEQETYDNVTRILQKIQKESQAETESVYVEPMNHLIRSCLFLLRLKSPSTQENISDGDNLVPDAISRSLSQDNRNVDANKVKVFRQWLQNWKKWKQFKKEGKVELKFPVSEISQFVNSWIPIQQLQKQILNRCSKIQKRIKFYELNNLLLKQIPNSYFSKYIMGASKAGLKGKYCDGLQSVPSTIRDELMKKYEEYSLSLQNQENQKFRQLPLQLIQMQEMMKQKQGKLLQKIKLIALHLFMIESENPKINLDVAMYFIPYRHLTLAEQELSFISSLIVQRAFLVQSSLQELLEKLWSEVGFDSISCRRWRDYFFIERVQFLLRKIQKKCRGKLQIDEKQKIAQAMFYLVYHVNTPIIARVCLRILRYLKISLKSNIKTPFDFTYYSVSMQQNKLISEQFKIEDENSYNNPELLSVKIYDRFTSTVGQDNPIRNRLMNPLKVESAGIEEKQQEEDKYHLILNLNQEEEIVWLVQALYYIEQMQQTIKPLKDWEEYLAKKNKKKEKVEKEKKQDKKQDKKDENSNQKKAAAEGLNKKWANERIFFNIPENIGGIDPALEARLPIGWFLNYCNVYNEMLEEKDFKVKNPTVAAQPIPNNNKKGKGSNQQQINQNQNQGKKNWNPVQFFKIFKKFQELTSKPLEEPKQDESAENKAQFVQAKNFISRMRKHCNEASIILSNFTQNGYYIFRENIPHQKCKQLCELFTIGSEYRLKQIPCEFKVKDYAQRLSPSFVIPTKKSQLRISLIKSEKWKKFQVLMTAPSNSPISHDNNSSLFYTNLNLKEQIYEDISHLPYQEFPNLDFAEVQDNEKLEFGKEFIESNLCRMKQKFDEVRLPEYPNSKYFLAQGGLESGMKSCCLVPAFDSHLSSQNSTFDHIKAAPPRQQILDEPQQIIQKAIKIMKGNFLSAIKEKKHAIPYMTICFYLQKISNLNMDFIESSLVKKFGEELYQFTKNFSADKSTQAYLEQNQIFLVKMLDNENENMRNFRLYRHDDSKVNERVAAFINKDAQKEQRGQINNEAQKETLDTHHCQKSNYLLPIHPPIPQPNNLLLYWQKNILPRIYEFVKTTLKPLQIEDFFEQMRIPLRDGDQLQAKKVAFVICDNKLPNGAVLPDNKYNWNSLNIEELTVGQDVLIKMPKHKNSCFSPLILGSSHEYRVGQVICIDTKNNSVLIKHRIPQYSIFGFSWVPVGIIEPTGESLAHYSSQFIFKELQKSFEGMIYNYSKVCLTKLSNKVALNINELIQETITDLFRDDPISAWDTTREWALRPALKKMLKQNNVSIIDVLEKQFCTIKSYDVDLFSQKMIKLNRFDNVRGLVVSFKKNASLVWYSGVKFYADEYGYKQIKNVYASKSCVSELEPLTFKNPDVYCKYYTRKEHLKAYEQNKYDQKQITATVLAIPPIWTVSMFLSHVISEIALEENNYEHILTRLNKVYISWLCKRNNPILSAHVCYAITKISHRIRKIYEAKDKLQQLNLAALGTSQKQIKSLIQWISILLIEEEKETIVLYSPLLQNLSQVVATLFSGFDKIPNIDIPVPQHIEELVKIIKMAHLIQKNIKGQKKKSIDMTNDAQWERFLLIDNIPKYIQKEQLREKIKSILMKNNGKILTPTFDIFCHENQAIVLVDSWDVTELVEEQIIEKIENEEEKQAEEEQQNGGDGGMLMMQWQCQICTFFNNAGAPVCDMCQSPAPPPPVQEIKYEKVQTTDVNKASQKLKEKEMKRFESVKEEINQYFDEMWKKECAEFEKKKEAEEKAREEKKKKKGKMGEQSKDQELVKPQKMDVSLMSGSSVLQKAIIEQFFKKRFENLPQRITRELKDCDQPSFFGKFKLLFKCGYDFWGDQITNEQPELLSFEYMVQLMEYIQDQICKGSSSVLSYSEQSIRLINQIPLIRDQDEPPINFTTQNDVGVKTRYKRLAEEKSYNLRYSWKIIKDLNLSASKCLPFVNMDIKYCGQGKTIESTHTLAGNLKYLRKLVMGTIKYELFQKIMVKSSVSIDNTPKVALQRLKIKQDKQKDRINRLVSIKDKEDVFFLKAHEQLQSVSPILLRPFRPKGAGEPYLSFSVVFRGQAVQGQAGPYRQFFTDISKELQPQFGLNMFIKTPNNKHAVGDNRQKWSINPKATSTYYLSLFRFLGILMGVCIRTGVHMAIDISNFCWKLIADEKVKDFDFDEVDHQFIEQIKLLLSCTEDIFDSLEEITGEPVTWTYRSMDGEDVNMIANGNTQRVVFEDRFKYIQKMKEKRIEQIRLQTQMIREGLVQILPAPFLNQISGEELRTMVCGIPKVDVELLKKHTKYAGGLTQESPTIKFFWDVMRQISEPQRLKIIKFCWGQERLPLNSEEFERNGIRFMIKPMMNNNNHDKALPKADTCFFNIELPQYSTKEIMKEKILLAVNLDDTSINADRVINEDRVMQGNDNRLLGNVDYDEEDDEEYSGGGG